MTPETRARLEQWREAATALDRERDNAIRAARSEGGSLREIAEIVGLSHTEIRRIINNTKGADQ